LPHRPVPLLGACPGGEQPVRAGGGDRESVVLAPLGGGVDDQAAAPCLLDRGGEGVDLGLGVLGFGAVLAGAVELEVERRREGGVVRRGGGEEVRGLVSARGAQREVVVGTGGEAGRA